MLVQACRVPNAKQWLGSAKPICGLGFDDDAAKEHPHPTAVAEGSVLACGHLNPDLFSPRQGHCFLQKRQLDGIGAFGVVEALKNQDAGAPFFQGGQGWLKPFF